MIILQKVQCFSNSLWAVARLELRCREAAEFARLCLQECAPLLPLNVRMLQHACVCLCVYIYIYIERERGI